MLLIELISNEIMLPIVLYPDERLFKQSTNVRIDDINDELRGFLDQMLNSMYIHGGIGLAAPQVGRNESIVVIDIDRYLRQEKIRVDEAFETSDTSKMETLEVMKKSQDYERVLHGNKPIFMINPEITYRSKDLVVFEEGCLSLPGIRAKVRRHKKIKVRYYDENANECTIAPPEGILTVCIQHEIDHINGVLFIDHLSRIQREFLITKMIKGMKKRKK